MTYLECLIVLSSAIKCYQVLPSAIKCCAMKKLKKNIFFALKKQHYVCIRIKKTVEKFVG